MKFHCPSCDHKIAVSLKKLHIIYSLIIVLLTVALLFFMLLCPCIHSSKSNYKWPSPRQVFKGFKYKDSGHAYTSEINDRFTVIYFKPSKASIKQIRIDIAFSGFAHDANLEKILNNIFPNYSNELIYDMIINPGKELIKDHKYGVDSIPVYFDNCKTTMNVFEDQLNHKVASLSLIITPKDK